MNTLSRRLAITLCLNSIIPYTYAGPIIGIGLESGEKSFESQSQELELELELSGQRLQKLNVRTGKFENDNTFVQLYHPEYNPNVKLVNRDVMIALPSQLTYDSLMEALMKIRAAKVMGANHVSIHPEGAIQKTQIIGNLGNTFDLKALLVTAGADHIIQSGKKEFLVESKPRRNSVNNPDYWVGGSNHEELLSQLGEALGKKPMSFADLVANESHLNGRMIYWLAAATEPVNHHFFTTLAQIRWMSERGAVVHLISPYLPYARSDKPEYDIGVAAQGRLAADLIEMAGTHGITVVRAHAPQSLGFFRIHANEISGRPTIIQFLKSRNIDCVISPDAGFQKDATKYQYDLNRAYGGQKSVCLAVMNKQRNFDGKEQILGGTGLENIEGKNVVIIDDETSSGGTLHQVAEQLQKYHPASIFAVVTHLAGPAKKSLNSPFIQSLVVTNTLPIPVMSQKLTILSIASEIAAEIQMAEENR